MRYGLDRVKYFVSIESTFRARASSERTSRVYARCICRCGTPFVTLLKNIVSGNTSSCGCRRKSTLRKMLTTHGETLHYSDSKEVRAYYGIRKRCLDQRCMNFHLYGGRGIKCKFQSFQEFLAAIGRAPSDKHSVDRVDVNGHYEAGNVRWATRKEQNNNTRLTLRITIGDKTQSLAAWCEETGVKKHTFFNKRRVGIPAEQIFGGAP